MNTPADRLQRLTRSAGPMSLRVATAFALAALLCVVAMAVDDRVLDNGDSVWLKPLRFSMAFALHLLTIAWLGRFTHRQASGDRWFGHGTRVQAVVAIVDIACIALQAARGVHSHFNYTSAWDHAVFTVMGLGTAVLLAAIMLQVAGLLRWPASPLPTRAAIAALALAVLGGLVGVIMVMPTAEQRLLIDAGQRLAWIGGALSATPSGETLPFLGWDRNSGDWRLPHFLGLHGLQALPLLAWLLQRRAVRVGPALATMACGGGAYALAFLASLAITANGSSALSPTNLTLILVWLPLLVYAAAVIVTALRDVG